MSVSDNDCRCRDCSRYYKPRLVEAEFGYCGSCRSARGRLNAFFRKAEAAAKRYYTDWKKHGKPQPPAKKKGLVF